MLHQTHHHHPIFFQPFLSFYLPSSSTLFTSSLNSSPKSQVESENMECVEAAFKTSIRKEMGFKSFPGQQAALLEDLCAQNGASCEDFSVDELFDFSNEDQVAEEEHLEVEEVGGEEENKKNNVNSLSNDHVAPPLASELCVPADDVASLEWLSHFVEDSNSEYATPFPTEIFFPKDEGVRSERGKNSEPVFKTPVPAKARSKRTRIGVRVWPSSESSSNNSTTTSSASSSPNQTTGAGWLIPVEPAKKRKHTKKKMGRTREENRSGPQQVGGRRCSHCGVHKTPQWRTGPMGAKTLCNACGVRFKSGRLLPEYRPACSPTFSSELHSNHHRKVLEMRRKKEMLFGGPTSSNPGQVGVPSF